MEKLSKSESAERDEYGWTAEELQMPLVFNGQYLDLFPKDGSKRMVKSAARWDGHNKRVIIKAVDGFEYIIKGVINNPDYISAQNFYAVAQEQWLIWYRDQLDQPENNPLGYTRH